LPRVESRRAGTQPVESVERNPTAPGGRRMSPRPSRPPPQLSISVSATKSTAKRAASPFRNPFRFNTCGSRDRLLLTGRRSRVPPGREDSGGPHYPSDESLGFIRLSLRDRENSPPTDRCEDRAPIARPASQWDAREQPGGSSPQSGQRTPLRPGATRDLSPAIHRWVSAMPLPLISRASRRDAREQSADSSPQPGRRDPSRPGGTEEATRRPPSTSPAGRNCPARPQAPGHHDAHVSSTAHDSVAGTHPGTGKLEGNLPMTRRALTPGWP